MKKIISLCLVLIFCLSLTVGCSSTEKNNDKNTLTITVHPSRVAHVLSALEKEFPDINFEINYYIGDNTSVYLSEIIRDGVAGDLIFYTAFTTMKEETDQLLDLSGYKFVGNIDEDIMNLLDVDGSIYQIPGPMEMRAIAYNKTMFEENGWEVPLNFDEQIELITKIRNDKPELVPLAFPMVPSYSFVLPATYAQAGYLSSPAGYEWEQSFFAGENSFGVGLDEGFTAVERLIDAGAFGGDKFVGVWDCNEAMQNREAAMCILWGGLGSFFGVTDTDESNDEYGLIPFYGQRDGASVIGYNPATLWSINKRLGEKGNEKKLENALKVMEWIASTEGQECLRGNAWQMPVTKGAEISDARITELMGYGANGFGAPGLYSGYTHFLVEAGQIIQDAIVSGQSSGMRDAVIETSDSLNKDFVESGDVVGYARITETMTEAETTQLMANILQSTGAGDLALITHTGFKNDVINSAGCGGVFFEGGISEPRILVVNADRNYFVTTLQLTGAEIKQLLEQGKGMYKGEDQVVEGKAEYAENADALPQEYFEYFWSGIDVTLNKNGDVSAIVLNGKALSDTETYKVVFAEYDYPREYNDKVVVTETLVANAMISYFEAHKEIAPPEVLRK